MARLEADSRTRFLLAERSSSLPETGTDSLRYRGTKRHKRHKIGIGFVNFVPFCGRSFFMATNSAGKHPDCLTHALDNLFIVAIFFGTCGLERRTQTNFVFNRRPSNERASDSFQHVRRSPVIG